MVVAVSEVRDEESIQIEGKEIAVAAGERFRRRVDVAEEEEG